MLPGLAHSPQKGIGPAQQQHMWHERMAAGEHGEVLQDNGVKKRGHQLGGRKSLLLQAVDVGLGKDAAFARDGMDAHAPIGQLRHLIGGNVQLGLNLVNDRAGAARAFVVHRGDLPAPSAADFGLEYDDLGVLAAEFDDRLGIGMQLLDSQRDGVDLLHETSANRRGQRMAAGAGDEDAAVAGRNAGFAFHAQQEITAAFSAWRVSWRR